MKIVVKRDTPAFVLLLNSIGREHKIIENMKPLEQDDSGDFIFDLELKINGQDINFNNFVDSINNGYNKAVNKGITEYISEKLSTINGSLDELQNRVENLVESQPYSWERS